LIQQVVVVFWKCKLSCKASLQKLISLITGWDLLSS